MTVLADPRRMGFGQLARRARARPRARAMSSMVGLSSRSSAVVSSDHPRAQARPPMGCQQT
jgi:hypothetical protein